MASVFFRAEEASARRRGLRMLSSRSTARGLRAAIHSNAHQARIAKATKINSGTRTS